MRNKEGEGVICNKKSLYCDEILSVLMRNMSDIYIYMQEGLQKSISMSL